MPAATTGTPIANRGYFATIWQVARSCLTGLGVTMRYFVRPGTVCTLQYPLQKDNLPERHRGIHFLETEKCIMCWKCARACPVDCIDIEGTRDGEINGAYQGKGVLLTRFTIDYSRCIFCNLCCEPCPELCIHMGQEFDYSAYHRDDVVKNLLSDRVFTKDDKTFVLKAREEAAKLAAAKKAAKAAAAPKPAAPAAPGAAPAAPAAAAKPPVPPTAAASTPPEPPKPAG
ncbi:MAG: NADH-quinone oxidoreductase subunit I [Planctomycetales bacterium]|nr:NADH-quinone oxidoreductase subunit I [Planctomycetales bacterium]